MNRPNEADAGLTSRVIYIDDARSPTGSHLSASEPLLEEDIYPTNPIVSRPKRKNWLSFKDIGRSRRKPSRPGNEFGAKPPHKKRKRPCSCWRIGIGILVLLYVFEMGPDAAHADFLIVGWYNSSTWSVV